MKFLKASICFLVLIFTSSPLLAVENVYQSWVKRYNGSGNDFDRAEQVVIDRWGNVFVTGTSRTNRGDFDYVTIKYLPADGFEEWILPFADFLFGCNPVCQDDQASGIAVNQYGEPFVTGIVNGTATDYGTVKYDLNGNVAWVMVYNGPADYSDAAMAIALDGNGDAYVTGASVVNLPSSDIVTIKYGGLYGNELWRRNYNGTGNGADVPLAMVVDGSNNVCVTGRSWNGTSTDFVTLKYTSNGTLLWVRTYNGLGDDDDVAWGIDVDANKNIYVTGNSDTDPSLSSNDDIVAIKYDSLGNQIWVRSYNNAQANSSDDPSAIAVAANGNVYVCGSTSNGSTTDFLTICYSSNGDQLWVKKYEVPGFVDFAADLAVDSASNVYVTGSVRTDYYTIKYSPTGDSLWAISYNGPANGYDAALSIAVEGNAYGNVYITGESDGTTSDRDYATIKYVQYLCVAKPGDANADGSINLADIIFLENYIFRGGPAPNPICRGDANGNGLINLADEVYLVNYVFKGGPPPVKTKECCL